MLIYVSDWTVLLLIVGVVKLTVGYNISDGLNILAVEPNIEEFTEFEVVNYKNAIAQADIVTFLVAHKEFKELDIQTNLDFCGVQKWTKRI